MNRICLPATIWEEPIRCAILESTLIVRLRFSSIWVSLLFKTDLIITWNSSVLRVLPNNNIKPKLHIYIHKPRSVWGVFSIISREILFTISILYYEFNEVFWAKPSNMGYLTDTYINWMKSLEKVDYQIGLHIDLPSSRWKICRLWTPY